MKVVQNQAYSNNINFQNIGYFKARRISGYLTNDIPFEKKNINNFRKLIEINNQNSVSRRLINLLETAKDIISKNETITSSSLFAATLLLFRGKKEELESVGEEKINPLLKKYNDIFKPENPTKDIPIRNINTYLNANPLVDLAAPLIKAIDKCDAQELKKLAKIDNMDWNIVDENGDNILLRCLKRYRGSKSEETITCIQAIRDLPEGKFNINYVNSKGESAFTYCQKHFWICNLHYELLKFKDLDINRHEYQELSPIAYSLLKKDFDFFKAITSHPNFNYKNIDKLANTIQRFIKDHYEQRNYLNFIEEQVDMQIINRIKYIYDKHGTFTIDEVANIVNYPNFWKFANMSLNSLDERLGHILAEISPKNDRDKEKMVQIFRKLANANYYFNNMNCLQKTGLDKAIEANNPFVANLFRKYLTEGSI